MHKLCEIHVMMNLLTVLALLQGWGGAADFRRLFLIFYGFLAPVVMAFKITHILRNRKIDSDYRAAFDELP
jgi:hypothetical protein